MSGPKSGRARLGVWFLLFFFGIPVFAQPLRDLAGERGIRFGAAVEPSFITAEPLYGETLAREYNQVEPENAMKFGPIHPRIDAYDFAKADAVVKFGREHGMAVRGHTLVWHSQNPSWLTGGGFNSTQLADILQRHIQTVAGRYAGQVYAWDVVNEAFDGGGLRSTIWYNTPGIGLPETGYIEQAFRWAHDADPAALLFYNDYGAEGLNEKSNAIYAMARDFKSRGVPIHGVGLQMHWTKYTAPLSDIEDNIRRLTELGLEVHITELDVRLPLDASGNASAADLQVQAQIYRDMAAVCMKFPLCTSIQTWGFTDRHSWVPGTFSGTGAALIFDASYQPKPAYDSLAAAFRESPPVIAAQGLTNAASRAAGGVAPGEIVTLSGVTYGPASLTVARPGSGAYDAELAGARLLFDGVPSPLLYAKVGQVAAAVPFSVVGKSTAQVQYEYRGVSSNAVAVDVLGAVPGLFTVDGSGQGAAAALDAEYRVISEANAVPRRGYIQLFATGGGAHSPSPADGEITPAQPAFPLAAPVTATIGGVDCPVTYAGAAPGLIAGVAQINIQVADGVPSGPQPVIVRIGAAASQPGVTVWIQ
jgi:endo-1,4-beta-xylanase